MPQTVNLLGSRFRIRNDRQAKALTGCSAAELAELLPVFEQFLALHYRTLKLTRQRSLGGGKKGCTAAARRQTPCRAHVPQNLPDLRCVLAGA